jgi:hypothetical protein
MDKNDFGSMCSGMVTYGNLEFDPIFVWYSMRYDLARCTVPCTDTVLYYVYYAIYYRNKRENVCI